MTHVERHRAALDRGREMAKLFLEGKSMADIGETYGVDRSRVLTLLHQVGVSAKSRPTFGVKAKEAAERQAARVDQNTRRRWGISRADYIEIRDTYGDVRNPASPFIRYQTHRNNARKRGVEWKITFAEWWAFWCASGKWERRGRGQGYCMARYGDAGPYAPWNVYLCTSAQNVADRYLPDRPRRRERGESKEAR